MAEKNSSQEGKNEAEEKAKNANQESEKIQRAENDSILRVTKPFIILMDIYGVTTSWNFTNELTDFFKQHLKQFLKDNWDKSRIQQIIERFKNQTKIDFAEGTQIPLIEEQDENICMDRIIDSATQNILWQIHHNHRKFEPQLNSLRNLVWSNGYDSGLLKTHFFQDVPPALNHWRFDLFVKIYSFASGPQEGQKKFFRSSVFGDLTKFITNYLDSSGGYKFDPAKYRSLVAVLRERNAQNIIYLTDGPKKAKAAIEAGLRAIVVIRPGNKTYTEKELSGLSTITSFGQIEFQETPENPVSCC